MPSEFTGTFSCPANTVGVPGTIGVAPGSSPFALIAQAIMVRIASALGLDPEYIVPVANENYEVTVTENLFAYVRFYGPSPTDPSTGAPFGDYGAGRRARVIGRRFRVYVYTRSGEDTYGSDTIALMGNDPTQTVETPPTPPGQFVSEEVVINCFDDFTVLDGAGVNLMVGPVHWVDSASGPPVRKPEDDAGLIRSELDFQMVYILAQQKVEPAPRTIPIPQQIPS